MYNKIWKEGGIPADWNIGIILPIHKKETRKTAETTEYIIESESERILENRLRSIMKPILEEFQSGFRTDRSVSDHTFSINE